jgi:hypothetical protein
MALNPKTHRLNRDDPLEFTADLESDGDISDTEDNEVTKHLVTHHQRMNKWAQQTDQMDRGVQEHKKTGSPDSDETHNPMCTPQVCNIMGRGGQLTGCNKHQYSPL